LTYHSIAGQTVIFHRLIKDCTLFVLACYVH